MTKSLHVAVLGGGPSGLAAALGIARRGHRVTVVERDPSPGDKDLDEAFSSWRRKGVPQIRQGHFIMGRAKEMLDLHAPDVIEALAQKGIVPAYNPMLMLVSEDELQPGDDHVLTPTRRIPFELTLRRVAEAEPGVEFRSGVKVTGLSVQNGSGLPRVNAVGLDDGSAMETDFVIDAMGNHSPAHGWLRSLGIEIPDEETQDTGVTYYGRYFRAKAEAPDPWVLMQSSGRTEYLAYVVFPGDNGTYGVVFFIPSWDRELRALRTVSAWEAAAAQFPPIAPWVAEDVADALTPVDVTSGHNNVIRPFLVDGLPKYLGLVPVGDALGTVDPRLAWGISLGLTHGFAAAAAIDEHAGDPGDAMLAYAESVMNELEECHRFASAGSRLTIRMWKGEDTTPRNVDEERALTFANFSPEQLFADPVILRGAMRAGNLIDTPDVVFDNVEFVEKLRAVQAASAPSAKGTSIERDELIRIAASQPAAVS
jgi:2-polyprenyl-6-methoxyphenol hydroxylase-like FAD-dependent oxidoreductase